MKSGIIYVNYGDTHLARLCVSIASLRKHYSGYVTVYCDNGSSTKAKAFFKKHQINVKPLKVQDPSLAKLDAIRKTKYDFALYLDSDTLIKDKLNHLFKAIQDEGLAVANFMDFEPTDSFIKDRMRVFAHLSDLHDDAMKHPVTVTGGVFGFKRNHPILDPLAQFTEHAVENKVKYAFDSSLMLLTPQYDHWIMSAVNCMSSRYNNEGLIPKIIHYHGNRHVLEGCGWADQWKEQFNQIKSEIPWGDDPQLKEYMDKHLGVKK